LRGRNEVPPVRTNASGFAVFKEFLRKDSSSSGNGNGNGIGSGAVPSGGGNGGGIGSGAVPSGGNGGGGIGSGAVPSGGGNGGGIGSGAVPSGGGNGGGIGSGAVPISSNANQIGTGVTVNRHLRLKFRLRLLNIRRVTEAHIHLGQPGTNGPVVAYLYGPNSRGAVFYNGSVTGTLQDSDLVGPLAGTSIVRLVREINRGNAYVNVLTRTYPGGEIRGQIR